MKEYVPDPQKAFGDTFDILRITDEYSKSFLSSAGFFTGNNLGEDGNFKFEMDSPHLMSWKQLVRDGYATFDAHMGLYQLKAEGRLFIKRGGYAGLEDRILASEKLVFDQGQSVINTNNSIGKINKWFGLTIGIAILGSVFQILSFTRDNKVSGLEKQIKTLTEKNKQIQSQLDLARFHPVPSANLKDSSSKKP